MKYCPKCGNELSESDLFCSNCGNKLDKSTALEKKEPKAESSSTKKQKSHARISNFKNKLKKVFSELSSKKNQGIRVAIGVAVLVIVIIIICLVVNSWIKKANTSNQPAQTNKGTTEFVDTKLTIESLSFRVQQTIKTAKLNVLSVPYEGIAHWVHQGTDVGYIRYSGTIKYGADFDNIRISTTPGTDTVQITIPKVELSFYDTDKNSFVFMFQSKKIKNEFNKSSFESEYYNLCNQKMIDDINNRKEYQEMATEYVTKFLKGLTEPLATANGYKVEIIVED